MKPDEAIELLKNMKWSITTKFNAVNNSTKALDLAISALEKQETAKIVVGKSRGGVTLWHECSKCGEPVDAKDTYCSGCGRKLSYEEEEA